MVLLLLMAGAILARVGEGSMRVLPRRLITGLAWFTTIYAGLSVVLNLATPSARERALWAPVTVVLLVLVVVTMVGSRRDRTPDSTDEGAHP
jgi:peptidoglycan/LPS O-acetylase OafA/YrhL